jgi:hypothetical protein
MGSPRNFKITTPADLALAEFFLSQERQSAGPGQVGAGQNQGEGQ